MALCQKTAWYNELGIRYRNSYFEEADTSFFPSRGLKLKSELRYYFLEKEKGWLTNWRESYYMAVNLFYTRDVHATSISYIPKGSPMESTDNFGVKKNVFGLNLLAGAQVNVSKRISLDVYAGLGLRIRDVATSYKEYIHGTDTLKGPIDVTIAGTRDLTDAKGGTSTVPNLTAGLRFCWRLK